MEHRHFLIVDDSESARHALLQQLAPTKANVITARDGLEGKKFAEANSFDLIITDIEMPRLNGLDLCRSLKHNPHTAKTPIIILSSLETENDIDQGFRVGADAYVSKSNVMSELIPKIRQVLEAAELTKDRSVLIVDDSEAVTTHIKGGLTSAGYNVTIAHDGQEALNILKTTGFDLILTDLIMPNKNGRDLCRAIKHLRHLDNTPVVLMSNTDDMAIMNRMVKEGATAYLLKPFNVNNLIQVMERIFSDQYHMMEAERLRLKAERQLTLGAISSLVRALEARDQYTKGHSESVTRIAMGMATRMGFTNDEMARLHLAGFLHDLGKIGIRDNVLLKPGRLSPEEFEHIKEHTTFVETILDPLPGMQDILIAASSHHERWDGSGYPKGLSGRDIPLLGRILAVADVFDAMTSDRVYRAGMNREAVKDIIVRDRGVKFCPRCVDAFLEWYDLTGGIVVMSGGFHPTGETKIGSA